MDAATKIKTFLTALFAGFVLVPEVRAADEFTPPTGIAAIVSDWLSKTQQFSIGRVFNPDLHLGSKTNKLGADAPFVAESGEKQEANFKVFTVQSDQGIVGTFTLDCLRVAPFRDEAGSANQGHAPLTRTLQIAVPMKFSDQLHRNTIGNLVTEVIACGHRICTGSKCYDVKDEPVTGTHCDTEPTPECPNDESFADEEPIQVVPMAPPPPPPVQVALNSSSRSESALVQAIVTDSKLQGSSVSIPLATLMDLMVAKTELSIRLEMTEQIMLEREAVVEKIQQISERNAQLATQLAVAEVRQQLSDVLTANIVERTEIAMKHVSHDSTTSSDPDSNRSVQTIHEDLSNIRRQIALLRRSHPVAFAPSYLGIRLPSPYVLTSNLIPPPCGSETERGPECTYETSECEPEIVK